MHIGYLKIAFNMLLTTVIYREITINIMKPIITAIKQWTKTKRSPEKSSIFKFECENASSIHSMAMLEFEVIVDRHSGFLSFSKSSNEDFSGRHETCESGDLETDVTKIVLEISEYQY